MVSLFPSQVSKGMKLLKESDDEPYLEWGIEKGPGWY